MLFIAQPLDYFHLDQARMCARSSDRFATLTQVSKFTLSNQTSRYSGQPFRKKPDQPVIADASIVARAHGGRNALGRIEVSPEADSRTMLSERDYRSFACIYVAKLPSRLQRCNIELTLHKVRSARPK